MSDDGRRFEDLVSVGLDETLVEELKRQLASDPDHPARRVVETRAIVSGTNPGGDPVALCLPASHPRCIHFSSCQLPRPLASTGGWRSSRRRLTAFDGPRPC
jgi:hypothetical protein